MPDQTRTTLTDTQLLELATEFRFDGIRVFFKEDVDGWVVTREPEGESLHLLAFDGTWSHWAAVDLGRDDHRSRFVYNDYREAITFARHYKDA